MPLSLHAVKQEEVATLSNLLQFFLHETSRYTPRTILDDGRYDTTLWTEGVASGTVQASLIKVKGKLAGFAIIQPHFQNDRIVARSLSELFIIEGYRGFGIGEEIARMIFDENHGLWQIQVDPENSQAQKFWATVLYRYTADDFRKISWHGDHDHVFEFKSPGPRPQVDLKAKKVKVIPDIQAEGQKT
ncbi:MAG: hypothetical protein KF824_00590 [Fimbriimonadaceae bacterium]|nr:MAG: hypothetical protein KF824_00590 [Fimbriimonadaceae bacterium]